VDAACTDRDPLLRAVLRQLADDYAGWRAAAGDPEASGLRAAYTAACDTLGRPVRALLPDGTELSGTASAVDRDGRLVVTSAAGERALAAADVRHVRPAG
jgi:BirA family biotin operon repressor/biotin-[acetyl-CoA-carboxylase] ligase